MQTIEDLLNDLAGFVILWREDIASGLVPTFGSILDAKITLLGMQRRTTVERRRRQRNKHAIHIQTNDR